MKNGIFTLNSWFWVMEYDNGKTVTADSICEHLYLVDGALNLNNKPIPEKIQPFSFIRDKIYMGAEVPFVKPRILSKNDVVSVIHSFEIAEKYTGYPITYFTKSPISQKDFGTGWAREEYCDRDEILLEATFSGKRKEPHYYDLEEWIQSNKLLWLIEKDGQLLLNNSGDNFPYKNLFGRKNPFHVQNGKIIDLPNPTEEILETNIETFMPGQ